MRGPPSPASLWWCTALAPSPLEPPLRFAQNQFPRETTTTAAPADARAGECASVTARNRACVSAHCRTCLGDECTCTGVKRTHTHTTDAQRHAPPPTSLRRGGECAYVRVKSGPPIDSEQLRAGLDRPVLPLPPCPPTLRHPSAPPRRGVASPLSSPSCMYMCALCVCIRKMNALPLRGRRSCHARCSLPPFFEIYRYRYSIRPPIWISVCLFAGLTLLCTVFLLG